MRWIVPILFACVGCGGPQIPTHSGYKSEKVKPWTSAKTLKVNEKNEFKADGELSYPDRKRARYYVLNLPVHGEVSLQLEISPPGEAVNEDFDLAFEVLDPKNRVIAKSDLEDDDAHELMKTKTLVELEPGRYLIHLYLQSRMDTAEYALRGTFKPTAAAEVESDFPAQVAFLDPLPMVPLNDETPKGYKEKKPVVIKRTGRKPTPVADKPKTPAVVLTARIMNINVEGGNVKIIIGRGTTGGAHDGMRAKLSGIADVPTIRDCKDNTCVAYVKATPDQVKAAGGSVTLLP